MEYYKVLNGKCVPVPTPYPQFETNHISIEQVQKGLFSDAKRIIGVCSCRSTGVVSAAPYK